MRALTNTSIEEVVLLAPSVGVQAIDRKGSPSIKQLAKYGGVFKKAVEKLPPRKGESANKWLPRAVQRKFITPGMEQGVRKGWEHRAHYDYNRVFASKVCNLAFTYMEKFKNVIPDKQYADLGALVNILTRGDVPTGHGITIGRLLKRPVLTEVEKTAILNGIAAMCDLKPVTIKAIEGPPIATKTREIKVAIPLNDLHNLQDYDRSKDFEWNWNNLLRLVEQKRTALRASTIAHNEAEARYTKACNERSALHKRHNDLHVERNILQNTLNVEREKVAGGLLKTTSERVKLENALEEAKRVNDRLAALVRRYRNFIIETLDDVEV